MTSATSATDPSTPLPPDPAVLIAALGRPEAYPDEAWGDLLPPQRQVEVVHTHISVVFLTCRRAYKLKKPLQFWGLLDYSTPERRLHWCYEEVRLNSRLAPHIYLGVAPVLWSADGTARIGALSETVDGGDHVVVMRRFAASATLAHHLMAGTVSEAEMRRLGERISRFHSQHPLPPEQARGAARRFAAVMRNNVRATRAAVPALFPQGVHDLLVVSLARGLRRSRAWLRRRLRDGQAVDGHGDLRLEHVLLEPEIAVVDGVEFNPDLRQVDRVSDLAFLVMDLQASGHGEHVAPLLAGYGQPVEPVVLQLFCAYRAHVRAKVEAATSAEADIPAAQRRAAEPAARNHLSLALAYACLGVRPPALVLLHGVSGSGKSHLAARLAPWLLADHHRSDRIRKRLHGLDPLDRPSPVERQHLYGPAADRRTEVALLAAAEASLRRGCWVLLDATHLRAASRKRALALAQSLGACPLLLDVRAPEGLVRERLRRRVAGNDDPSDADLTVRLAQDRYAQALSAEERLRTVPVESSETMDSSMVLMGLWDQWARLPEAIQGIQPSASP